MQQTYLINFSKGNSSLKKGLFKKGNLQYFMQYVPNCVLPQNTGHTWSTLRELVWPMSLLSPHGCRCLHWVFLMMDWVSMDSLTSLQSPKQPYAQEGLMHCCDIFAQSVSNHSSIKVTVALLLNQTRHHKTTPSHNSPTLHQELQ